MGFWHGPIRGMGLLNPWSPAHGSGDPCHFKNRRRSFSSALTCAALRELSSRYGALLACLLGFASLATVRADITAANHPRARLLTPDVFVSGSNR